MQMVELFAEYDPMGLLPFLRASERYPLEEAHVPAESTDWERMGWTWDAEGRRSELQCWCWSEMVLYYRGTFQPMDLVGFWYCQRSLEGLRIPPIWSDPSHGDSTVRKPMRNRGPKDGTRRPFRQRCCFPCLTIGPRSVELWEVLELRAPDLHAELDIT